MGGIKLEKKGQAAMEFLMTYGWAILVVLIAIGALAYFGVLNPSRFLPASCTLMPGLSCDSFKVDRSDDTVTLNVRNGLGDDLTGVTFTTCGVTSASQTLNDGESKTFTMNPCASDLTATRFKEDITISYTQGTGATNISHSRTGQLVTEVEA